MLQWFHDYGTSLEFTAFFRVFVHNWRPFASELFYLHQTFTDCVSNQYIHFNMPDVPASCGMPLGFITFCFEILPTINDYSCLRCCIFTKLSQIACLINVHVLKFQYAKYDCRLWKVFWFNYFFLEFYMIKL